MTGNGLGDTLLHRYRQMRDVYGQGAADQVVEAMGAELNRLYEREVERLMNAPAQPLIIRLNGRASR